MSAGAQNQWRDSLLWRAKFARGSKTPKRTDREFAWGWYRERQSNLRARAIASGLAIARRIGLRASMEQWFTTNVEALWETRAHLYDDLSRVLFDSTILLRVIGHERFVSPRVEFEEFVSVESTRPMASSSLPSVYVGIPLEVYNLRINAVTPVSRVSMISTREQVEAFNVFRQYLIQRERVPLGPQPGDVVFDCGACIGDVSTLFAALVGSAGRVHMFDPVPLHARYCRAQAEMNEELREVLVMKEAAIGARNGRVGGGLVSASTQTEISPGGLSVDDYDVVSIDEYANDTRVNFIKLDVEGAEGAALDGASETIRRFRPTLAVCAYHRLEDFWVLPQKIRALVPDYRMFFEHHSPVGWESVLYAVPPERCNVSAEGK